jgi:hypothetical protein
MLLANRILSVTDSKAKFGGFALDTSRTPTFEIDPKVMKGIPGREREPSTEERQKAPVPLERIIAAYFDNTAATKFDGKWLEITGTVGRITPCINNPHFTPSENCSVTLIAPGGGFVICYFYDRWFQKLETIQPKSTCTILGIGKVDKNSDTELHDCQIVKSESRY